MLYKVTRNHSFILITSDFIVRQDLLNAGYIGNLNFHTCFVTKFISERRHGPSEPRILHFVINDVHAYSRGNVLLACN